MEQRNDELMHYGVPGMRWGVRRGRRADAKGNAMKLDDENDPIKLDKMDRKISEDERKALDEELKSLGYTKEELDKRYKRR